MLEEVGQPYDLKLISLSGGDNLKPDYLAINPMGKVPALKHGDTVITELLIWMNEHGYDSVRQMRGSMSRNAVPKPSAFERAETA